MIRLACLVLTALVAVPSQVLLGSETELGEFREKANKIAFATLFEKTTISKISRAKSKALSGGPGWVARYTNYVFKSLGKEYVFKLEETFQPWMPAPERKLSFNKTILMEMECGVLDDLDRQKIHALGKEILNLKKENDPAKREMAYWELKKQQDDIREKEFVRTRLSESICFEIRYWKRCLTVDGIRTEGKNKSEIKYFPSGHASQQRDSIFLAQDFKDLQASGLIEAEQLLCARVNLFGAPLDGWIHGLAPQKAEQNLLFPGVSLATRDPEHPTLTIGAATEGTFPSFHESFFLPEHWPGFMNSQQPLKGAEKAHLEYALDVGERGWVFAGMHFNGRVFVTSRWVLPEGTGVIVAVQYLDESEPRFCYFDQSGALVKIQRGQTDCGFLVNRSDPSLLSWKEAFAKDLVAWSDAGRHATRPLSFKSVTTAFSEDPGGAQWAGPNPYDTEDGASAGEGAMIYRKRILKYVSPRALN